MQMTGRGGGGPASSNIDAGGFSRRGRNFRFTDDWPLGAGLSS